MNPRNLPTIALVCLLFFVAPPAMAQRKKPAKSPVSSISAQEAKQASERIGKVGQQLQGVKKKINSVRQTILEKRHEEKNFTAQLATLGERISKTKARIGAVQNRLRDIADEQAELLERIGETQIRLKNRRALLSQRLQENYVRGQTTYVQVLLQSRSINEMLSRNHYVRHIVESDAHLIESVKTDIAQMQEDKHHLERKQQEQQSLASEYESQKQQYLSERAEQQVLLHGVQVKRQEAEEVLDELEEAAQEMNDRIRHLSAILKRRREIERQMLLAARKAAILRAKRENRPPPEEKDLPKEIELPGWNKGFRRPVAGSITSGFGNRYHPILHRNKRHTGVDFGVPHGTPIHAAGTGVVIMAGYYKGYGNTVILDHGKGVTTLYGHCSALLVSEGKVVKVGEVIARVGSTGMSTGPHLHWEVRHNGTPVNPL